MPCRSMGISILPPDINRGRKRLLCIRTWSIRYGLSAIKSVGRPVVDAILEERKKNGIFSSMEDFINRMTNKEVNRRTIENFIKSGAMDSLPGTRRQKVAVAPILLDNKARERKNAWEGQMSLFDLVSEEEKKEYQVSFPDVGEYSKEELLAFEKDILGVYISGHPLDDYEGLWRKNITATSADFIVDEETEEAVVKDGMKVVIGGLVGWKSGKDHKEQPADGIYHTGRSDGLCGSDRFSEKLRSGPGCFNRRLQDLYQGQSVLRR